MSAGLSIALVITHGGNCSLQVTEASNFLQLARQMSKATPAQPIDLPHASRGTKACSNILACGQDYTILGPQDMQTLGANTQNSGQLLGVVGA